MRSLTLIVLTLAVSGSAALAMPGATVGIPLGSPDPFGTMRRGAEPPSAASLPESEVRRAGRSGERGTPPKASRPQARKSRR